MKEVQAALLDGRARVAVHSAKDLPSVAGPRPGAGGGPRARRPSRRAGGFDPRRCSRRARRSPPARSGAGRSWPIARPDLTFTGLRGNIATRLEKIPAGRRHRDGGGRHRSAGALARRPGPRGARSFGRALPQVGQGALGHRVPGRRRRGAGPRWRAIEHAASRRTVDAERAFLAELGGDCDLPAGAHATLDGRCHRARGAASPAPTVTSCCARSSAAPTRSPWAAVGGPSPARRRRRVPPARRAGREVRDRACAPGRPSGGRWARRRRRDFGGLGKASAR